MEDEVEYIDGIKTAVRFEMKEDDSKVYFDKDDWEIDLQSNNSINCEIGAYYGPLFITKVNDETYWAIEDWNGCDWKKIPMSLYNEILKHLENSKN